MLLERYGQRWTVNLLQDYTHPISTYSKMKSTLASCDHLPYVETTVMKTQDFLHYILAIAFWVNFQ